MTDLLALTLLLLRGLVYLCLGLIVSIAVSAVVQGINGTLPEWDGTLVGLKEPIGYAAGSAVISTALAIPIWLVGCIVPALRWQRAWWLAIALANGVIATAVFMA